MPEVYVDIEVWCSECGEGICDHVQSNKYERSGHIKIQPCKTCIGKLESKISELKDEIENLKETVEEFEKGKL